MNTDNEVTYSFSVEPSSLSGWYELRHPKTLQAEKIFYRPPYTTVLWNDGSRTTVKAHCEEFSKELGLAWATVKKMYANRAQFIRDFESGIDQLS